MAQSAPTSAPDTNDMVIVHRVFRRELRLLPLLVEQAGADAEQIARVAAHAAEIFGALHHHHSGEDELLWPKLRARAELDDDLLDRMEAQHEQIGTLLTRAEQLFPAWAAAPAAEIADELVSTMGQLCDALDAHLAEEEARILPLTRVHLTAAEWGELGERGMASLPKDRLLVFLGYILEEADEQERREFLAHVPLPGRLAYRMLGQRRYQKEISVLRRGVPAPRGRVTT